MNYSDNEISNGYDDNDYDYDLDDDDENPGYYYIDPEE